MPHKRQSLLTQLQPPRLSQETNSPHFANLQTTVQDLARDQSKLTVSVLLQDQHIKTLEKEVKTDIIPPGWRMRTLSSSDNRTYYEGPNGELQSDRPGLSHLLEYLLAKVNNMEGEIRSLQSRVGVLEAENLELKVVANKKTQ